MDPQQWKQMMDGLFREITGGLVRAATGAADLVQHLPLVSDDTKSEVRSVADEISVTFPSAESKLDNQLYLYDTTVDDWIALDSFAAAVESISLSETNRNMCWWREDAQPMEWESPNQVLYVSRRNGLYEQWAGPLGPSIEELGVVAGEFADETLRYLEDEFRKTMEVLWAARDVFVSLAVTVASFNVGALLKTLYDLASWIDHDVTAYVQDSLAREEAFQAQSRHRANQVKALRDQVRTSSWPEAPALQAQGWG